MAEEVKYIPYGTGEIDYNQFLENSANQVQSYVNSQPWSQKRKRSFLNAYQDLMTRGVTGASNTTGVWTVNHNGEQIDLDSLSKIDREMYGEAAYFIQQQMSGLPTKQVQQQKTQEEKSKLPLFDNNYFTSQFHTHISNNMFGGRDWTTQEDWNVLDDRGENGLRGTTNRANKLADMLQSYSDSLEEGKYNFENTPFKDLNDLKSRIGNTISALRDNNPDNDTEALNQIGLKYNDYLYNGSNDSFKKDGYEGNYGDYYERYLPEQEELKRKQQVEAQQKEQQAKIQQQKQALANQYKRFRFLTGQGKSLGDLSKYPDVIGQLSSYTQLDKLTPDQKAEVIGAFRGAAANGQLQNLSKEELQRFGKGYTNQPNRLKKLPGLEGFYWDTIGDRVIQPFTDLGNQNSFQNLINNSNSDKAQEEYLKNTEWTADQTRELVGIAADVASVIDPEPFSAASLALTGTGLRTWNRIFDEDGFTLSDLGHTVLDTGLSALGSIPVVGDAALAARIVSKLQKASGWLGGIFAAASVPQAAKAAWNKVVNGQDMTVDDWRAIGNVLMGATQARRIQLNKAAGNAVKNQKSGTKTENVGEVEVKINGKTEKVEVDEATAKELQQAYKKAGKSQEETTNALRHSKVKEILAKKKTADGKPAYTKEQIDAIEAPRAASGSVRGRIPGARDTRGIKIIPRTVATEGTPLDQINVGRLGRIRLNAMQNQGNRGPWMRGDYGWNMRTGEQESKSWLKTAWDKFKNPYTAKSPESTPEPKLSQVEINNNKMVENALNPTERMLKRQTRVIKEGQTQEATLQDGNKYTFGYKNNTITIQGGGQNISKPVSSYEEAKLMIADFIKTQNSKVTAQQVNGMRKLSPEFIKSIRDLKRKGFLYKEGGTLDKTISDFLNNNI